MILAHRFARVRCESGGENFLIAYSCKGRGICSSCNTKRMFETVINLEIKRLAYLFYKMILSVMRIILVYTFSGSCLGVCACFGVMLVRGVLDVLVMSYPIVLLVGHISPTDLLNHYTI
ncbi:MAG TPA: hypothetical protein EYQ43_04255 [Methyloprofundus sp.]|nr:hypothetical protein [Methyloprofundus sp.]